MKRNRKILELISYTIWFNQTLIRNPLFKVVVDNLSNQYTVLFQGVW